MEGDEPDALADLRHAHVLPREDLAEIHFLALEADPAAFRHRDRLVVKGTGQVTELANA